MSVQDSKTAGLEFMAHGYDPRGATIDSVQRDIFSGATTCRHVVASFIARILAFNDELRAVIAVNPKVFEVADALDAALANGETKGSLFGIPVLLKDNFDEINMKTTSGCKALADLQPGKDAATVTALKDAGAIVLGKANLHELALEGLTVSSMGGQTLNPYDLTRTPGGSSGGSGVAVAASLCVFSTGTDTMNSLRSPASANNLFSIKPTWGLISGAGVVPNAYTQDVVGPIARCTKDLATALTVMASAKAAAGNSTKASIQPKHAAVDYCDEIASGTLQGLRLGLLEPFVDRTGVSETSPVNKALDMILANLRHLGSETIPVSESIYDVSNIARTDTQQFEFREALNDYLRQSTHSGKFPASFEELYHSEDILVIPSRRNLITMALTSSTNDVEYKNIKRNIEDLKHKLEETFARLELDALIYPEQRNLVVKIGAPSQHGRNGLLAAVTGWPVVTVPMGFSPPTDEAPLGIPMGMEILGRPGTEQKLLQMAYQIETKIMVKRTTPQFTDHFVESNHITGVPPLPLYTRNIHQAYPPGSWLE